MPIFCHLKFDIPIYQLILFSFSHMKHEHISLTFIICSLFGGVFFVGFFNVLVYTLPNSSNQLLVVFVALKTLAECPLVGNLFSINTYNMIEYLPCHLYF